MKTTRKHAECVWEFSEIEIRRAEFDKVNHECKFHFSYDTKHFNNFSKG